MMHARRSQRASDRSALEHVAWTDRPLEHRQQSRPERGLVVDVDYTLAGPHISRSIIVITTLATTRSLIRAGLGASTGSS
jgi:hypothetical protein